MAQVDLINDSFEIDDTMDSIVIPITHNTIRGGRALDVTGFPDPVIKAGHVIIVQDSNDVYKPMPVTVSGDTGKSVAYASLPAGHSYAGILRASILTRKPSAAIVTAGQANPAVVPFSMDAIMDDFVEAVPLIEWQGDI